jgi:hypothetical protein
MIATICGPHDDATFANSRSVGCIREGNCPQILGCTAVLNRPRVSPVSSPDDRAEVTDDRACIRVDKGSTPKVISLWKGILPVPLRA